MKLLRVVVIDDEKNAVEGMLTILKNFCTDIEIVGTANNASSGIEIINKTIPDLAFIDIEMPDANGFDVINSIKNKNILMVFVTAFDQYAVRAFKSNVIGYLLKPVDIEDVQNIVEKAKELTQSRELLENLVEKKSQFGKITVPTNKGLLFIEPDNILYIKADGRYSSIHFANNESVFVSKNIGEIEELLDPDVFFRAHHSSIINLKYVCELNSKEGGYIVMTGGTKVLLSRRKKDEFLKIFKK